METFRKEPIEKPLAPRESRWREFWRLFRKNQLAFVGLLIFVVFFFTALVGLVTDMGFETCFRSCDGAAGGEIAPPALQPEP